MHLAKTEHHNARLVYHLLPLAYGDNPTMDDMIADGLIAGSNLAEIAISKRSGIPKCPEGVHRDLMDDTDVKTITVQEKYFHPTVKGKANKKIKLPRFQAVVKHAYKKIGLLRIVCYNPFSERYHYFMIPASAYYSVKNITIAFDKETQLPIGKFAVYECDNFDDVCRPITLKERIDQLCCNITEENLTSTIDEIFQYFESATNTTAGEIKLNYILT